MHRESIKRVLKLFLDTKSMMKMIYTGVDIHEKVCAVCLKDEKGKILREFQIRNTREGIGELLASLRGREASVVMESTALCG